MGRSFVFLPILQISSALFAARHTRNGLQQGVSDQLSGLLAVLPLRQRPSRHQSCERGMYIVLPLLLGAHKGHACALQSTEIDSLWLLHLLTAQQRCHQVCAAHPPAGIGSTAWHSQLSGRLAPGIAAPLAPVPVHRSAPSRSRGVYGCGSRSIACPVEPISLGSKTGLGQRSCAVELSVLEHGPAATFCTQA
jgi:hypothetical protein